MIENQKDDIFHSGLFDFNWYRSKYSIGPECSNEQVLDEWWANGWKEEKAPNYLFDIEWYLTNYQDVAESQTNPLWHYLSVGEARGYQPSPLFQVQYYQARNKINEGKNFLAQYLNQGFKHGRNPNPCFDSLRYSARYRPKEPDAFRHYVEYGVHKGFDCHVNYDADTFEQISNISGSKLDLYKHYLTALAEVGVAELVNRATTVALKPATPSDFDAYLNAGPDYEEIDCDLKGKTLSTKLIAYYLPQFHTIAENDQWWGAGYTEWRNVVRARPQVAGHYQPHLPRDLGYYDLLDDGVMARQIELAQKAGIHGFCFYYYSLGNKRLLERPLDNFLADASLDMNFCLMWANHDWRATWEGGNNALLLEQRYDDKFDIPLVDDIATFMQDPRYIRINGKPILCLYDATSIGKEKLAKLRELFYARHKLELVFVMAQSSGLANPKPLGVDAAVEFPPHKLMAGLFDKSIAYQKHHADFKGRIYHYEDLVEVSQKWPAPAYDLIRCVAPSWDAEPRRPNSAVSIIGSTPEKYKNWLINSILYANNRPFQEESIVFINAWNEWGESAHLEPDIYYGSAYLNATAKALIETNSIA